MADEDLNTEGSEKDKAEAKAAEKAFTEAFENTDGRDDLHMVGGDDDDGGDGDADDDNDNANDGDGNSGDDDQGDAGQDDKAGDKGKQDDKAKVEAEPTIKDVIAMVQNMQGTLETKLTRQVGGMLGRLEKSLKPADVTAAKDKAADAAKDAGKKVPTKDRVEAALKSAKGFADMEKDFPDYAAVLRDSLTTLVTEMDADKPAAATPVNEDALVDKAVAKIRQQDQQTAAAQKEAEAEFAKIEDAWPGWQPMLKGKDWETWSAKKLAGPDGKEYDRIFKSGSTRETISVFQEFSNETGIQPKKKDGTQSAGNGNQQASNQNKDRQRRAAARPKGSAAAPVMRSSEEEIFLKAFKGE